MWLEIIFLVLTVYFLWQNLRKPANYPPGPWGLPLIGSLPLGKESFEDKLARLKKQHGNVVSWRVGTKLIVILFDYKIVKEAFGGFDMIDRPEIKLLSPLTKKPTLGVVGTSGIHWHTIRRFSLRHLRDLGMGKSRLVSAVQYEAMELVEDLKKKAGTPTTFPKSIIVSVLNVVWQLMASKRYGMDDNQTWVFHDLMGDVMMNGTRLSIGDFFPWVKAILPKILFDKLTLESFHETLSTKMINFLQKYVNEHMENLDPNDPKDYIDNYLLEMEKQKDDPNSFMSIDDLLFCIADLFGAGTETTTTTLHWIMLYLAKFQKVQAKLQEELDVVLPKGTQATLEDRQRLPYTDAFIHEVLRYSSLASAGAFHKASKDVMIEGYLVPKDAFVVSISYFSHHDPKYFESPSEFRPERFLNTEGRFVSPKDGFFPFGTGRRQCVGEALARMEIFIFLTTLVQNLHFDPAPGKEIDLVPEPNNPFLRMPKDGQKILISLR